MKENKTTIKVSKFEDFCYKTLALALYGVYIYLLYAFEHFIFDIVDSIFFNS